MDMSLFPSATALPLAQGDACASPPPAGLAQWMEHLCATRRDPAERAALAASLPALARALQETDRRDVALTWLSSVIGRVREDDRVWTRLAAAPHRIATLVGLPDRAPRLAELLATRPVLLLDWLSDDDPFAAIGETTSRWTELASRHSAADTMAQVSADTHASRFAMEMAALSGRVDPLALARANTALADGAIGAAQALALRELADRHGDIVGGEMVVLAMGRFGGGELTAQSDLDLVFLFTGEGAATSDGRRAIDAAEYFDRAAVLMTRHLATHSVFGPLYEVDTRLRPWGEKGPRACSITCLDRYLADNAGVWEFMAMTRARPVIGSPGARAAVTGLIARHEHAVRTRAVIDDARAMRMAIARHKPPRGALDVKLVHGGLVDLEFAVHIHQLRHGIGCVPGLGAAISAQVEAGLADPELAPAHRALTGLLIALRLTGAAADERLLVAGQAAQVAALVGCASWDEVLVRYKGARGTVQRALRNALQQPGR